MAARSSRGGGSGTPGGQHGSGREKQSGEADYEPRKVAGVPSWALAMIGAGTLALAAGGIGYWSADRSVATQPVAFAPSAAPTPSATTPPTAGPDGMFATPTPLSTTLPTASASAIVTLPGTTGTSPAPTPTLPVATPVRPVTPKPVRTTAAPTTAPTPTLVNPATATPSKTTPKATVTKPPTRTPTKTAVPPPAPATSTRPATPSPTATTPDPDEIAIGGPPSGLIVTAEDLNYGKCPAKFSSKVSVQVEYGTLASAKAQWSAQSGAKGSADLAQAGSRTFAGTVSGIPTKTEVTLTVEVTGPDGTTTSDPFAITHSC